jgi:FixJ family two-component response regulator
MKNTRSSQSAVYVVDDDVSVRNSLSNLFRSIDLSVEVFDSPARFLQHELPQVASCIVLDIRMLDRVGWIFKASW